MRGAVTDPFAFAATLFEPPPDYYGNPALWGSSKLGEHWWSMQVAIMESIRDNRYTAVPSCHNAGKSFIAARAIAKWIDTYPPGEAFVVTTAPTAAQVSAILWREIGKAHKKGKLAGHITGAGYPQWKLDGELVGYGRKPADYDDSAFQGIHARYVLVVLDEAGGIPSSLYDAADALATNENARVLAIGNPDDPTSQFATICKPDSGWNVIRIDGLLTPNMTEAGVARLLEPGQCKQCRDIGASEPLLARLFREEGLAYSEEEVPDDVRPMLLSPLWVEERLHRWVGRVPNDQSLAVAASQSAIFTAKVRGQFPSSGSEGVIPLAWVERAMDRYAEWVEKGRPFPEGRQIIGADIAGTGKDESCLALRRGNIVMEMRKFPHADTMEVTGHIAAALQDSDAYPVVDAIGIGAGVVDRLREQGLSPLAFVASHSAKGMLDRSGEFGFQNLRSAAWWNLRELLDPSRGATLALPPSEMLKSDLCAPRWKVLSKGIIAVESKDEIRKRLGRSTDEGDAVVQVTWPDATPLDTGAVSDGALSWWEDAEDGVLSWNVEGLAARW